MPHILPNARTNIMNCARSLVKELGIEKFNMRKLAAKCDMGCGTLYNYYATKNAILHDIASEDWRACCKEMKSRVSVENHPLDNIAELYECVLGFVDANKELWVFVLMAGHMTTGNMKEGRYSPERYFRDIHNILRPVLLNDIEDPRELDFICRFVAVNMCRHVVEYEQDFYLFEQAIKGFFEN